MKEKINNFEARFKVRFDTLVLEIFSIRLILEKIEKKFFSTRADG